MRFKAEHLRSRRHFGVAFLFLFALSSVLWSADTGGYKTPAEREAEIADAIKKNDEILVDWAKPQLTLVFSGDMDGYIEPCGCAGLENQLGGLKRRHTFLKKLAADGWNPVALDMGGLVKRTGPQQNIKYQYAIRALIDLGYGAVTFGAKDLQLSSDPILYALANVDSAKNPLVSANLDFYGMTKPFKVIEAGGKKIGVTAVMGEKYRQELAASGEFDITEPVAAITKVLPELEAATPDLTILMVHGTPDEATALAKQFPQFDFVGTTGGAETPPNRAKVIPGVEPYLIEAGKKGQYVTVIGVYDDPAEPFKYQRVPLDHRFEDSPEMQQLLVDYQKELETTTLAGLGLMGVKHPDDSFAGSQVCGDCHTEAMAVFENTPHAHATETLVKLDPPRQYDPECLSCHVTGWNPQEYFPYVSGFMGLKESPLMTGNGCENCHGPAASHVAAESGDEEATDAEKESLRAALRLKITPNEGNNNKVQPTQVTGQVVDMCLQCHDLDNSPEFDFQTYWPKVEHVGKE
ncbi:MAG: multiheme c-type cytochrome [Bythopirellula sp.]|nr:multiheme c-type cytochrome [Bythopirellula sp.]